MDYLGKKIFDHSLVDKEYVDGKTGSAVMQYQFPYSSVTTGTISKDDFFRSAGEIVSDKQLQEVLKGCARVYRFINGWKYYMLAHGRYKDENNWVLILQESSYSADSHLELRAVCTNGTVTRYVDEKLPQWTVNPGQVDPNPDITEEEVIIPEN